MRTRQPQPTGEGAPEWMVSYADMITIIMAFFVVMYSSAAANMGVEGTRGSLEKDPQSMAKKHGDAEPAEPAKPGPTPAEERIDRVMSSLQYRFGPEWTVTNCWVGGPGGNKRKGGPDPANRDVKRVRTPTLDGAEPRSVFLPAPRPDEYLVAGGTMYFDGPQAALTAAQQEQLRNAASLMAGKPQKLEIRGHTSREPLPAGAAFRDHWDLAYARCRAVRDQLVACGLDPRRFRLSVAADTEPVEFSDDPMELRRSSRVEVRLLPEYLAPVTGVKETVEPAQ